MRERLAAFALSLHADKTRLIEFARFVGADRVVRSVAGYQKTPDHSAERVEAAAPQASPAPT
jgi:hypothetical protein